MPCPSRTNRTRKSTKSGSARRKRPVPTHLDAGGPRHRDLENAAAVAEEKAVPLMMAHTAVGLYRLLAAQGKGEQEISRIVELIAGKS